MSRQLTGYRWVETRRGDTLQRIMLREFGDAGRWAELVHLNDLTPPYITDDPGQAGDKVLLAGQVIMVPAATPSASQETDAELVFGRDCKLESGRLVEDSGDFLVVAGIANLSQAIGHRIVTAPGELLFHGDYGCEIHRLLGRVSNETAVLLASKYVQTAVEDDQRVSQVSRVETEAVGDAIKVAAEVLPISGDPVTIRANIVEE